MLKKITLVVLAAFLWSSVVYAEDLLTLSLDDISGIGLAIDQDTDVKAEGAGSLRITTKWPTTINLGEFSGADLSGALVTFSAMLKSKDLNGRAYLEMWSLFEDGGEFVSRGFESGLMTKNSDWVSTSTPFTFKPGVFPSTITLNLVIKGAGTVWIDDVRLQKEPLK